jgi:hypothetical protein
MLIFIIRAPSGTLHINLVRILVERTLSKLFKICVPTY